MSDIETFEREFARLANIAKAHETSLVLVALSADGWRFTVADDPSFDRLPHLLGVLEIVRAHIAKTALSQTSMQANTSPLKPVS